MAKLQLTVEELMQFVKGEMPTQEMKQQLAKGMLEVWNSKEMQKLIEDEAEHLAKVKVERIIRDALIEKPAGYGRPHTYTGWALPILRTIMEDHFSIPQVLESIKPEIEATVEKSMLKALGVLISGGKQ